MEKHYFGVNQKGSISRFLKGFTDEQFEEIVRDLGGILPKGFIAWHFDEGEKVQTSKRVQAVSTFPLVRDCLGRFIDAKQALTEAMLLQREAERWTSIELPLFDLSEFEKLFDDCWRMESNGIRTTITIDGDGQARMLKEEVNLENQEII